MADFLWIVGQWIARCGWFLVDIGAAIAWQNKDHLPWSKHKQSIAIPSKGQHQEGGDAQG